MNTYALFHQFRSQEDFSWHLELVRFRLFKRKPKDDFFVHENYWFWLRVGSSKYQETLNKVTRNIPESLKARVKKPPIKKESIPPPKPAPPDSEQLTFL